MTMAGPNLTQSADADTQQLFVFELDDEEYAVDINQVQEIRKTEENEITPVPNVPPFIRGITNVRGQITPILDLEEKFGLEKRENKYIVIIDIHDTTAGMLVDDVHEVMRVSKNKIKDAPQILEEELNEEYISGVAVLDDRLIIILDLEQGLEREEAVQVEEISEEMSSDEDEDEEEEEVSEEDVEEKAREAAERLKQRKGS